MNILPATENDIPTIVSLHRESLPHTRLSRIGSDYLTLLYRGLFQEPKLHVLYVAREGNTLVGAISATKNLKNTSGYLSSTLLFRSLPTVTRAVLNGSVTMNELVQQIQFERTLLSTFPSPYATILTLFVKETSRNQGIGKKLVEEVKKTFFCNHLSSLFVDTEKTNTAAQHFYEKIGAKKQHVLQNAEVYMWQL